MRAYAKDECVAYLDKPRTRQALRRMTTDLLLDWELDGWYASIQPIDVNGTIYPKEKIVVIAEKLQGWGTPAVQAMVLHEIGHLVRGHNLYTHEEELLNYVDEYEADEFAFDAIQEMYGYVPLCTGLWMLECRGTWRWDRDGFTHPSCGHRWERLARNGYVPEDASVTHQALGLVNPKEYAPYG